MLLSLLLFIFYSILSIWVILKLPLIKTSGIKPSILVALFIIKLIGGLTYHYINTVRFYGGDAHLLFTESSAYSETLFTNPGSFINYFITGWNSFDFSENIFSSVNAIAWSNLSNQLNYRIITICNILSFRSEVVNYIFYNLIFFIGQFALYRVFANHYPNRKALSLLFIALLPSIWFWCSGVHKDGFVLSFIGFTLYYYNNYFTTRKTKYIIYTIIFLLLSLCIRYYLIISLLPMFMLYILSKKHITKTKIIFASGFIIYILLFFNISTIIPKINPPEIICKKQSEFLTLKGESFIPIPKLQPQALSFTKNLPTALNHCLVRPYITESKDAMYLLCSIETLVLLLLLIWLVSGIRVQSLSEPLVLFCLLFSLLMFIIIGYIVPFGGAFIRYRSEYFAFIFCALIGISKWRILDRCNQKLQTYIYL